MAFGKKLGPWGLGQEIRGLCVRQLESIPFSPLRQGLSGTLLSKVPFSFLPGFLPQPTEIPKVGAEPCSSSSSAPQQGRACYEQHTDTSLDQAAYAFAIKIYICEAPGPLPTLPTSSILTRRTQREGAWTLESEQGYMAASVPPSVRVPWGLGVRRI